MLTIKPEIIKFRDCGSGERQGIIKIISCRNVNKHIILNCEIEFDNYENLVNYDCLLDIPLSVINDGKSFNAQTRLYNFEFKSIAKYNVTLEFPEKNIKVIDKNEQLCKIKSDNTKYNYSMTSFKIEFVHASEHDPIDDANFFKTNPIWNKFYEKNYNNIKMRMDGILSVYVSDICNYTLFTTYFGLCDIHYEEL